MLRSLEIVALCVLAAIAYGIAHDQVTARICVEYFTIGHPKIVDTESPTILALVWGVVATWWVGLPLGVLLAIAARAGSRPKRDARSLVRPIAVLLVAMAGTALAAAICGGFAASRGGFVLMEPLASRVPRETHTAFLAAASAHTVSYAAGIVGGIVLAAVVWRSRGRAAAAV